MNTIYVSEPIHPQVIADMSAKANVLLGFGPKAVRYEDIADQAQAVMLRSEKFPAERIMVSAKLRVIARHGAGIDTVDVATAQERGIAVTYCPGGNANAVAEHVFALMLSLSRKIVESHTDLIKAPWPRAKAHLVGQELSGRTLGIIGFGEIGKLVNRIAQGFQMHVLAYDPFLSPDAAQSNGVVQVGLDELLMRSGAISLHAPLTSSTQHLINADRLSLMRPDAFLVNTSRSGLVDENALAAVLIKGTIAGAALDVAEAEQATSDRVMFGNYELEHVPNLILTPHIAGQTEQALLKVGTTAWNDVQAVLSGQTPRYLVGRSSSV
jgi:D-3-phosphoglycerate dehydrogenase / 2-oxoglutarate reductase